MGHSSATGANYVKEVCCIKNFEDFLIKKNIIKDTQIKEIWSRYQEEAKKIQQEVMKEKEPQGESIWKHIYFKKDSADWRKF